MSSAPAEPDPDDLAANVVLTGFMGTGKSTTGRLLAEAMGADFVDTDDVIESRHGPISQIFADRGEAAFRAMEHQLAHELAQESGLVIATGGRMLLDEANAALLERSGRIFCLVATAEELYHRLVVVSDPADRPLLMGDDAKQRIADLLAERADGYARFCQIDTTGRHPTEVATELAALVSAPKPC